MRRYKDQDVEVVRVAQSGDEGYKAPEEGKEYDPTTIRQILIELPDGTRQVVSEADLDVPVDAPKAAPAAAVQEAKPSLQPTGSGKRGG
jgi:hypothetical protein